MRSLVSSSPEDASYSRARQCEATLCAECGAGFVPRAHCHQKTKWKIFFFFPSQKCFRTMKSQSLNQKKHECPFKAIITNYFISGFQKRNISVIFLCLADWMFEKLKSWDSTLLDRGVRVCEFIQSCLTLCDPMDCSPPGSSVHSILQARILEWVVMPSSRGSSRPRDWTHVSFISCTGRRVLDPGSIGIFPNIKTPSSTRFDVKYFESLLEFVDLCTFHQPSPFSKAVFIQWHVKEPVCSVITEKQEGGYAEREEGKRWRSLQRGEISQGNKIFHGFPQPLLNQIEDSTRDKQNHVS